MWESGDGPDKRIPIDLSSLWESQRHGPGRLVAICGFDGAGKTTQLSSLAASLRAAGKSVVVTKQPTDWYRGRPEVRSFLANGGSVQEAEDLARLAARDRRAHIEEVIRPAIGMGYVVVTDRYVFSSIAYFLARDVSLPLLMSLNAPLPRPDLAVYLDVPPATLHERLRARDGGSRKREELTVRSITRVCANFGRMRSELAWLDGAAAPTTIAAWILRAVGGARNGNDELTFTPDTAPGSQAGRAKTS